MDHNLMQKMKWEKRKQEGEIIDKLKDNQKTPMCYQYLQANLKVERKINQTMMTVYLMKQTKWENHR